MMERSALGCGQLVKIETRDIISTNLSLLVLACRGHCDNGGGGYTKVGEPRASEILRLRDAADPRYAIPNAREILEILQFIAQQSRKWRDLSFQGMLC